MTTSTLYEIIIEVFLLLLTLIFITLKLCGVITWGWFWVLSPILLPLIIGLIIVGVVIVGAGIVTAFKKE